MAYELIVARGLSVGKLAGGKCSPNHNCKWRVILGISFAAVARYICAGCGEEPPFKEIVQGKQVPNPTLHFSGLA
jgi:hypothetical protein